MSIINDMKEQRAREKEQAIKEFRELKEYAKESFSKENREKELEKQKERLTSPEMKELNKTQYKTHMQLMLLGIVCMIVGFIFPPAFLLTIVFEIGSIACYIANRKRINEESNIRKNIK
jgi:uncharacterized membrane protein (DUF106 family)